MNPVSINISKEDHYQGGEYDLPPEGTLIKYLNKKRFYFKIVNVDKSQPYTHILSCQLRYKPSSKSRLRNKEYNPFSKFKIRIVYD